jgi:hypothetical protein
MFPADALAEETSYLAHVASLIATAPPPASFEAQVSYAQGAYPTTVREIVRRGKMGSVESPEETMPRLGIVDSALPIPHPLDFEWRFSSAGCAVLAERVNDLLGRQQLIGLFGTPWFAEYALTEHLLRGESTLFEAREEACRPLVDLLRVLPGDVGITTATLERRFGVILADPPWYPEVTQHFLLAASRMLVDGGVLLLCVPGLGTRPGLMRERHQLSDWAFGNGLLLEALEVGAIEYESPPFELAALAAAGLDGFNPFWRRGDLLSYRRLPGEAAAAPHEAMEMSLPLNDWREVALGSSRIRIDIGRDGEAGDFVARSIVDGDVLDTVSSRDIRRSRANLWTTSNRIFEVSHPRRLFNCLAEMNQSEEELLDEVFTFAIRLAKAETVFLKSLGLE